MSADARAGVNFMKPKGLLDAASMACQTSMSRWRANIAISLTRAMFTCRKVFSSSLASSASLGERTGTVVSTRSP